MFFELGNSRKGIITSISFDVSKLDKSVLDHLRESLGKNIKIEDGKVTLKTNMTLDDLKTLNDGYNEFHSNFILQNIIHFKKQTNGDSIKEKSEVATQKITNDSVV